MKEFIYSLCLFLKFSLLRHNNLHKVHFNLAVYLSYKTAPYNNNDCYNDIDSSRMFAIQMTFIEGYKTQTRLEHTEHLNESFTCMAIVDHTIDDDSYCIPGVSEQGEGRPLPPPPPMLEEGGGQSII